LESPDAEMRANAVGLLASYPGDFSDQALRERATDVSFSVRATVADVIGDGKRTSLLPELYKLFSNPAGLKQPLPYLADDEIQNGYHNNVSGNIHISAGFALLNFEVNQVSNILVAHLDDPNFRFLFLCKLAENNTKPWLDDMTAMMEARERKQILAGGIPAQPFLYQGTSYQKCWDIIYGYLDSMPEADFADGNMDRYLNMLENAGAPDSQGPAKLYELYRKKGLEKRAVGYRKKWENSYDLRYYFAQTDNEFTNQTVTPSR
jgi:hypothetical protein